MKFRACEPSFAGSGRLALGPPPPKGFFASKLNMAILAATSGAIALFMAAKAGREMVANENKMCLIGTDTNDGSGYTEGTEGEDNDNSGDVNEKPLLYNPKLAQAFRGGFNQHVVHSAALLAVPYVASQPAITTTLLVAGTIIFCGTQYHRAFNRDPDCCEGALMLGTITLLGAWLSFLI